LGVFPFQNKIIEENIRMKKFFMLSLATASLCCVGISAIADNSSVQYGTDSAQNLYQQQLQEINSIQQQLRANFNNPTFSEKDLNLVRTGSFLTFPEMKVTHSANEYVLQFITPGLSKNDIKVEVKGFDMTVSGTNSSNDLNNQLTPTFKQDVVLPKDSLPEKIVSKYSEGLLTIIIPKNPQSDGAELIKAISIQ